MGDKRHTFPNLKNREWWTKLAANILDMKLASTAAHLSTLRAQETESFQLGKLYVAALNQCLPEAVSVKLPKKTNIDFDRFDPMFPTRQPLFEELMAQVRSATEAMTSADRRQLRTKFGSHFQKILKRDDTYKTLAALLETYQQEYDTDEGRLLKHTNAILQMVSDEPLPIEPDLTLWKIYTSPSARYWSATTPKKEKPEKRDDLLLALKETINDSKCPIILHGQPGHGKSSTVRMLTQVLAAGDEQEPHALLFYEFKNLGSLDGPPLKILQGETPFIKDEAFFMGKQTLLVLDGLDERQAGDGTNDFLRDFIRGMFRLAQKINGETDSRLNLIITGRSLFVDQIKNAFTFDYFQFEIEDFDKPRIKTWLTKYTFYKYLKEPLTLENLQARHLDKLMSQPILLTIAARVLVDPKGVALLKEVEGDISRAKMYEIIVSWTYRREWQQDSSLPTKYDEDEYTRFLMACAFIITRFGSERIPLTKLAEELKKEAEIFELDNILGGDNLGERIKALAVGFYFEGLEEKVFAFIHKSIRDYLTVKAQHYVLNQCLEVFNPKRADRTCQKLAGDLYALFGHMQMRYEDHRAFVLDFCASGEAQLVDVLDMLTAFFKRAYAEHPYLTEYKGGEDENIVLTEVNLLTGILEWIGCLHGVLLPEGKLELFDKQLGGLIHFVDSMGHRRFATHRFQLVNAELSNNFLPGVQLGKTDLSRANLHEAYLNGADLDGANLYGAILSRAYLDGANLDGANLYGANLSRANLDGANLYGANLEGANLSRAYLDGANLDGANLSRAYLDGAYLDGANLEGANLDGAILNDIKKWSEIRRIKGCDITNIQRAPEGFREWCLERGAFERKKKP